MCVQEMNTYMYVLNIVSPWLRFFLFFLCYQFFLPRHSIKYVSFLKFERIKGFFFSWK